MPLCQETDAQLLDLLILAPSTILVHPFALSLFDLVNSAVLFFLPFNKSGFLTVSQFSLFLCFIVSADHKHDFTASKSISAELFPPTRGISYGDNYCYLVTTIYMPFSANEALSGLQFSAHFKIKTMIKEMYWLS